MIKDDARTSRNIEQAYNNKLYIVTRHVIYQPEHSTNAGYYAMPIYHTIDNMTKVGRYHHMTGKDVNRLIGFELVNDL